MDMKMKKLIIESCKNHRHAKLTITGTAAVRMDLCSNLQFL